MPPRSAPTSTTASTAAASTGVPTSASGNAPAALPRLLTLGRVRDLFCARLGISETTYYESFRDDLPVVYIRMVPVRGRKGEFKPGSPRLSEDVARELVELAATGGWLPYVEGRMQATHPHLYSRKPGAA